MSPVERVGHTFSTAPVNSSEVDLQSDSWDEAQPQQQFIMRPNADEVDFLQQECNYHLVFGFVLKFYQKVLLIYLSYYFDG